jgi:hypothetical protein
MIQENGLLWTGKFIGVFRNINPGHHLRFRRHPAWHRQVPGENPKLGIIDPLTRAGSLAGDTGDMYNLRGLEFISNRIRLVPAFILLPLD